MYQEEIDLVNFAKKHKIKLRIDDVFVQKHPLIDEDTTFYHIKISRGRKSFVVVRNPLSFGDENGLFTQEELTAGVLTSLPRFEPISFEDYYRDCCGEENTIPREKVKKWHETEMWEYNQVLRLFSDILDELIEIISG